MKKNFLVTGGAGYVGSVLVNALVNKGHSVTVIDTMWFGNTLPSNNKIKIIKKDIREINDFSFKGFDSLIQQTLLTILP